MLSLPGKFVNIHYCGRAPEKNYWDRKTASDIERYSSTIAGQWTDYIRPQENGERTDVRWVALTNRKGIGLLTSGEPLLEFNASYFTPEDLSTGAQHDYQADPARRRDAAAELPPDGRGRRQQLGRADT
jgi:beta-galactosidase